MNKSLKTVLITIVCFALYSTGFIFFREVMLWVSKLLKNGLLSYFVTYIIIGIPIFAGCYFVSGSANIPAQLGLAKNIVKAFLLSLLFTLPMFLGGGVHYVPGAAIDIPNLIAGTLFAGFFEELYFRGFLFGQVFRHSALGFIPSIVLGAFVFASLHLYQGDSLPELTGIFLTTFAGAVFFAWLYAEWDYNLWVSIWLHTFMNLSWMLFSDSFNALGSWYANIFRVLTIAFSIVFTIVYKKRKGQKMAISRETLWMKEGIEQ